MLVCVFLPRVRTHKRHYAQMCCLEIFLKAAQAGSEIAAVFKAHGVGRTMNKKAMVASMFFIGGVISNAYGDPFSFNRGNTVVDSSKPPRTVGTLLSAGVVEFEVQPGYWISFGVAADGLRLSSWNGIFPDSPNFYFTSSNCTGTPYMPAGALPAGGVIVNKEVRGFGSSNNGILFYAAPPLRQMTMNSHMGPPFTAFPPSPTNGQCNAPDSINTYAGAVGVVATRNLSFTLPLKLH